MRRILAFAAIVEIATGLLLIFDPALVARLLLGAELAGIAMVLGRCFGVTLLALGVACLPAGPRDVASAPAFRAMLIYNVLIAAYLVVLGASGRYTGILLWPGAAAHAVVALLLLWAWRNARRAY